MRVSQAFKQAAQGDRITRIAERGSALFDEVDDMRVADALCSDVLQNHRADNIGRRIAALSSWMHCAFERFQQGDCNVSLPDDLRSSLHEIGEELRDNAETELDRLAMDSVRRMVRRRVATCRDQWALQRVLTLVQQDGFICLTQEPKELLQLQGQISTQATPIALDLAITRELRQVIIEFS